MAFKLTKPDYGEAKPQTQTEVERHEVTIAVQVMSDGELKYEIQERDLAFVVFFLNGLIEKVRSDRK